LPTANRQRLADLASAIPPECYDNPTWRGMLVLVRDATLYLASLLLLAWTDHPLWTLIGWAVAANAISALFVVGHDAAHGALFKSRRLNYLVGQLAMLPSLHAFSVWAYGHNRIHHAFACCQGLDFVWHPVTPRQYADYSPLTRLRHRIEWSPLGSGLYYARAMWLGKIVEGAPPKKLRRDFARDRIVIALFALVFATGCAAHGWNRGASIASVVWALTELFIVPWMLWNVMIGWTVYVHHIHPGIAWSTRRDWTKLKGHVEGTTNFEMPRLINAIWHNIFDHTAHHLDPRIPFYNLPAATDALHEAHGDLVERRPYRLRDYLAATRRCKLYDFERQQWVDYQGRPATAA